MIKISFIYGENKNKVGCKIGKKERKFHIRDKKFLGVRSYNQEPTKSGIVLE